MLQHLFTEMVFFLGGGVRHCRCSELGDYSSPEHAHALCKVNQQRRTAEDTKRCTPIARFSFLFTPTSCLTSSSLC